MRVASLLPSATELLGAIGAHDLLVGRSHECDHPSEIDHLPILTGQTTAFTTAAQADAQVRDLVARNQPLYTLNGDLLRSLAPDLILTQALCAVCSIDLAAVKAVADTLDPPAEILNFHPQTLERVFDDLLTLGFAIDRLGAAERAVLDLRARLYRAAEYVTPFQDCEPVAFLEWTDPLFIGGHWTPQLIERAGGAYPLNPTTPVEGAGAAAGPTGDTLRAAGKSIRVPPAALVAIQARHLIVCPCGLTLAQAIEETRLLVQEAWWNELPAVHNGRVAVVDGNQMFNRPGPRLVDAFEWLVGWLNGRPELIPDGFPWVAWSG